MTATMHARAVKDRLLAPDEADFAGIWRQAEPNTMTSFERGLALYRAVRHLVAADVRGAFVECGVWRGGSAAIMAASLVALGRADREIILFDTFEGMTPPSDSDVDIDGGDARTAMEREAARRDQSLIWARAPLDGVRAVMAATGYPPERVTYVVGDVRRTLTKADTGDIALLRLDTDFYDSTRAELDALYPRLVSGGVLLIDDYGHWRGCRAAVDEYFSEPGRSPVLLTAVDYTGRVAVKP